MKKVIATSAVVLAVGVGAFLWPTKEPVSMRDLHWTDEGDQARYTFVLANRQDQPITVAVTLVAERRSEGKDGSKVAVVGHTIVEALLAPRETRLHEGSFRLASGHRGSLSLSSRLTHSASNQPPQHNAGSRPSSDHSPASDTPSTFGPRG